MFNPVKNVAQGIGFIKGWLLDKDVPEPVKNTIESILETVEKPLNQWRQPITLDEEEIDRIASLIAERLGNEALNQQANDVLDAEDVKEQSAPVVLTDTDIKTAVLTNTFIGAYPNHDGKAFCYSCWYLCDSSKGERYPKCARYNINIRTTLTERICLGYDKVPRSKYDAPRLKCKSCQHYTMSDRYCSKLKTNTRPSIDVYGICPYWLSRFNAPLVFKGKTGEKIREIDKESTGQVDPDPRLIKLKEQYEARRNK